MISFDVTGLWSVEDPDALFQSILFFLASAAFAFKLQDLILLLLQLLNQTRAKQRSRPISIDRLESRFLSVFWLLRTSFWMSGPYFYSACASKMQNGSPLPVSTISQIALSGYLAMPIFGPFAGEFLSRKGPKMASIIAVVCYGIGAVSLCANSLPVLFLGRAFGGLGSSLMSSAPEAWVVAEIKGKDKDSSGMWLKAIFERAYQFDPILAIFAGKLAGLFAFYRGPTAPFQAQPLVLGAAIGMILLLWSGSTIQNEKEKSSNDRETLTSVLTSSVLRNPSILFVGCIQVLFESSMNIFVMLWPPTMNAAIKCVYGESSVTPYGSIFSCMMASCLVGGLFFGEVSRVFGFNVSMLLLLSCATLSMSLAAYSVANFDPENDGTMHLIQLTTAFMIFEGCVGAYFPSIGVLRCNHYGDASLQLLLTLFQLPTNAIVAIVFVCLQSLGNMRALLAICTLLGLGSFSMVLLRIEVERKSANERKEKEQAKRRKSAAEKVKLTVRETMQIQRFAAALNKGVNNGKVRRRSSLHEQGQDGLHRRASLDIPL